MLKLNLGCGNDVRLGYINVDFVQPCDQLVDLSSFPWPWSDGSVDEIIMLDFLEHFSYRETDRILGEAWRILKPVGRLDIQVPDFTHCALAVLGLPDQVYLCNRCGSEMDEFCAACRKCGQPHTAIEDAAIARIFGGQDRKGNWHHTAFTKEILSRKLVAAGFCLPVFLGENENGETYWQNWNIKARTSKGEIRWEE